MSSSTRTTLLALALLATAPLALEAQAKARRPIDMRGARAMGATNGFGTSNRDNDVRPVTIGMSHSSSLDNSDESMESGHRVELWAMELRAGDIVIVTARSAAFDTQLAVFDPNDESSATANDDMAEGNTNSQVVYRAARAGVVGILVTSYDASERGAYTLEVTRAGGGDETLAAATRTTKVSTRTKVAR